MIFRLGDAEPGFDGSGHFVAHDANVIGDVHLGDCASVWFGATIRGDNDRIVIGSRSNIQDASVLHTDPGIELVVGSGVTVGHRVMLHGCTIGDGSLIGIGSTVLNRARIGEQCLVGAHTLITEGKEYPGGTLIVGSPGRVIRDLTEDELALLAASAQTYVDNARRFREQLVAG